MKKWLSTCVAIVFFLGTVGLSMATDQQQPSQQPAPTVQQPAQQPAPAPQQPAPAPQQPAQQPAPAPQQPVVKEQPPAKPAAPEVKPAAPKEMKAEKAPAKKAEAKETKKAEAAKAKPPVNINTATEKELQKLPGIGKVLSKRIVEYRTKNGPFAAPEDLMKVKGITKKKFEAIKSHIVVQ